MSALRTAPPSRRGWKTALSCRASPRERPGTNVARMRRAGTASVRNETSQRCNNATTVMMLAPSHLLRSAARLSFHDRGGTPARHRGYGWERLSWGICGDQYRAPCLTEGKEAETSLTAIVIL